MMSCHHGAGVDMDRKHCALTLCINAWLIYVANRRRTNRELAVQHHAFVIAFAVCSCYDAVVGEMAGLIRKSRTTYA